MGNCSNQDKLGFSTQLAYGAGDLGPSMAGNTLIVFFFFFLTTIAGLPPNLAGVILLLSNSWSAISTLIVGILSDRTQSRWGRRRIWMLCSAPILGISFFLLWWVPPSENWLRFVYYLVIAILFQTAASAFVIPYGALVTDLTENHQEHIRLNSMRFAFSLTGCIGSLLLAQGLAHWIHQPQQQLRFLGLICALIIISSIMWCCWRTEERSIPVTKTCQLNWHEFKSLLSNKPLLILVGIYSLSWLAVQITPAILPYFVVNCMGLESSAITQIVLLIQGTALTGLFIWEPLSQQVGKKVVYWIGISFWILAELGIFQVQSGQTHLMYGLAIISGLGMATAYFIPSSMLPEVIDWDELQTGQRREGLFYSILMFLYQITIALGLFFVGQWLSWSGFQETLPGSMQIIQPDSALLAIRQAMVFLPSVALLTSLVLSYFYPINQTVHQDTVFQLQQRRIGTL